MGNIIRTYLTWDSQFCTWNIVNEDGKCLHYGKTVDEAEAWLDEHGYIQAECALSFTK